MSHRARLFISYDGTDFCGWQRQKNSERDSVQGLLEKALERVYRAPITLVASGRTDAGVHARAQVAHFDAPRRLHQVDLPWALRPQLPSSIVVTEAEYTPAEFHATLSAKAKTYRYYIHNAPRPSALLVRYSWWIRDPLDLEKLQELSQPLLGEHDFRSFQTSGTPVQSTTRRIFYASWRRKSPSTLVFSVCGSGFLKQMVRNLVGTLVEASRAKLPASHIQEILEAQNRSRAGVTAPPQGLFLHRVYYPRDLDKKCRRF